MFAGGAGLIALKSGGGSNFDWPPLAVSIGAVVIALLAFIYAVKSTHAAQDSAKSGKRSADAAQDSAKYGKRSADAAERSAGIAEQQTELQTQQTELQVQVRKDSAQPYVWVDVRPDDVTDVLLNLVVGNSGPTIAQNITATIDPPLVAIDQLKDRTETAQDLLARGISSLPPGRTLVWPLGQGFNILAGDSPKRHTITVTAEGPFGPVPPLTYVLDLTDYIGHMHRPSGSIHLLTQAVEGMGDKLSKQRDERSSADPPR
jgi:hypothetical protein